MKDETVSPRKKYATVAEYLADVPVEQRRRLQQIRGIVKALVPQASEVISYNIPAFRNGRVFIYYAAFEQHVSVFPPVRAEGALAKQLERYRNERGNLLFPLDEPLPVALLKKVVQSLSRQYTGEGEP